MLESFETTQRAAELAKHDTLKQIADELQATLGRRPARPQRRFYLTVPFREKDRAKTTFHAKWDPSRKQWYVGRNADFDAMPVHWKGDPSVRGIATKR